MSSWLDDFVRSLGHDFDSWQNISSQGVTTLVSVVRKSRDKQRSFYRWAEVSESDLREIPEDDFLRLLLWFTSGKPRPPVKRKTIFVTSSNYSESLRKDALRNVANVLDLEGEGVLLQTKDNSGGSDSQEPPGRMNYRPPIPGPYPESFSLATMIPGPEGEFGFNEVTLVIPEVPCEELHGGFRTPEISREGVSEAAFDVRMDVEATRPPESRRGEGIEFREESGDCFCRILRSSLAHIKSSLKITGGRAGRIVVIDLLRGGGGFDHPCMIEFIQGLEKLSKYWRNYGPYGGLIWQVREV